MLKTFSIKIDVFKSDYKKIFNIGTLNKANQVNTTHPINTAGGGEVTFPKPAS